MSEKWGVPFTWVHTWSQHLLLPHSELQIGALCLPPLLEPTKTPVRCQSLSQATEVRCFPEYLHKLFSVHQQCLPRFEGCRADVHWPWPCDYTEVCGLFDETVCVIMKLIIKSWVCSLTPSSKGLTDAMSTLDAEKPAGPKHRKKSYL